MPLLGAHVDVFTVAWLRSHGVQALIVLFLAILITRLAGLAVRRFRRRIEGEADLTQALNLRRAATLASLMANVVRVVIWTVAILMVLRELGLDIGPLLASAGIVGLALGFGAQTLVRDFLSGFFILLENQFAVGDYVEVSAAGGTVRGRVEAMTLRTVAIRQDDGTLSILPNGGLHIVSNKSRGQGRVSVEVRTAQQDPDEVERRLDELLDTFRTDPEVQRIVAAGPWKVAVESVEEELVITVAAETRPYRREEVEQELGRRIRQGVLPDPSL